MPKAATKAKVKAAKAPAVAPAPKQPQQNGITRPRDGTLTCRVWEICDSLSASTKESAKRADVMKQGEAEGLNSSTVATQFGRWRKFHGLGRYAATAEATSEATDAE